MTTSKNQQFLSTADVADMTGLSTEWFYLARKGGYGPPFCRVTSRIIRYDRDVVLDWFRERTVSKSAGAS